MDTRFLSHFTPSLMTANTLEMIFVQREELLQEILERIRRNVFASEKGNTLLIGPRGIGKTHLISLLYYRLLSKKSVHGRITIAWLREEEWGVACFRDLLIRIVRSLVTDEDSRLQKIYGMQPDDAEVAALALIKELVENRILIILMENLDDLVRKLGNHGETKFHIFLQQSPCCVVATSSSPLAQVFPWESSFRKDFFQVQQLKGLDLDEAIQLISRIARFQGNDELLSLISTPLGRARVRALRYLAGGNHRAYVIFGPLLTCESIGDLISPLMQTIDDLTPYYNSRIAALPSEQRQILEYVCDVRQRVRTNDVASSCFLPLTKASSNLETLCAMGYLRALRIGKDSYYELCEPLMRLSFEVKKHRGKPIGLLLDFLKLWYSSADLKQKISILPPESILGQEYLPDLKVLEGKWEDPRIAECCRDYAEAIRKEDYKHALAAAEDLVALRGSKQDSIAQALCLQRLGRLDRALAVYDKLIERHSEDASIWKLRVSAFERAGRHEEALACCTRLIELDSTACENWVQQASILLNLGRSAEAASSCEEALKLNDKDTLAWSTLGIALADLGLYEDACKAFIVWAGMDPQNARCRVNLCAAFIELKRWDDALEQANQAIRISPDEREPWVLLGSVLAGMKRNEESLAAFMKAVDMGEDSSYVQFKVVELLLALDRWREGIGQLDRALGQFAHSENPIAGDTKALIRFLLPGLTDDEILQSSIKLLLLIYRKHGILGALGRGLIEFIPEAVSSEVFSNADASRWSDSWQLMAAPYSEFQLPLRLLDLAVRYRITRDSKLFAKLPQDEREFLEALIQIEAIA
jgi:tetratricopeptide (TPR) repeat protein